MGSERTFVVAADRIDIVPEPLVVNVVRGPRWWRRVAERALRWAIRAAGAETERKVTFRKFHAANGSSLIERLHMQQRDMQMLYDRKAAWLLCGPQALYDLHAEVVRSHPMSFMTHVQIGGHRGLQVIGINVVMLPWMEGYLLVPDLEEYCRG